MKKVIFVLVIALLFSGNVLMAQRLHKHDPGYSSANYKHPNKAAYARLHNLDKSTKLELAPVERNDNYKQPGNKKIVQTAAVNAPKKEKKGTSYKHPMGL